MERENGKKAKTLSRQEQKRQEMDEGIELLSTEEAAKENTTEENTTSIPDSQSQQEM